MAPTKTNTDEIIPSWVSSRSHSFSRIGSTPRATDTSIWSTRPTRAMATSGQVGNFRPGVGSTASGAPLASSSTSVTASPGPPGGFGHYSCNNRRGWGGTVAAAPRRFGP